MSPGPNIILTQATSILADVEHVRQQISERAYALSRRSASQSDSPLENWLDAERELVWRPPLEVRQRRGEFEVLAAVAGVEPKDLAIRVASEGLLITGSEPHLHLEDDGTIRVCELSRGRVFRAVHFPERIDPGKVTAECHDGLLRITAPIAVSIRRKRDARQES